MSVRQTLARVDEELAAGRVPLARQRLRGLVSSFPADLELRRRLAEVYRLYGDDAEAGRWNYLEADRDPAETAAFEARYADPRRRMRALAWRGPEESTESPVVRERLAAVRTACSEAIGRPVDWESVRTLTEDDPQEVPGDRGGVLWGLLFLLIFLFAVVVWVNGFVAMFF
ncbi:hypothetical protein GL263_16740 [Streptomyces durbertensis]|uniref:Uncharacterized protein n=1 Tax=Streptomyces durbertensis TaxID=2448886 RepID=A0ABR6EJF1_9ACTN|nr:DUF6584 family protein [Streptomyces durbertensis]MBB1245207.1 hypothetical protein [Streptomyces durbertensis]